jgi:flagellar basal-body rod protein FlgB
MNINNLKLFYAMRQNMDWSAERQRVLAQNLANADTPGYAPSDLKSIDFKKVLRRLDQQKKAMAMTESGHMGPPTGKNAAFATLKKDDIFEVLPSGNKVVLEDETLKSSQTADLNNLTLQLYKKFNGMFRMAVRGPTG